MTSSDEDEPQQTAPVETNSETNSETTFVTVGKLDEIPAGGGKSFDVNDRAIAVFLIDGKLHAIEDQCPHMGSALSTGHLDGCQVTCAWHGWRFDVRDGAWCDNPQIHIDSFETRIVDGEIQIATTPSKLSD